MKNFLEKQYKIEEYEDGLGTPIYILKVKFKFMPFYLSVRDYNFDIVESKSKDELERYINTQLERVLRKKRIKVK